MERHNLRKSMEKLKADASDISICVSQLKGLHKHFGSVEANVEKRSRELELKENELQTLSSDIDKKVEIFEAGKSKAGDLKKLAEECTEELRSKRNELTAKLDYLTRIQREIELRKKQWGQYMAELRRLYTETGKVKNRKKEIEEETYRKKKDLVLILDQIKESEKQFVMVDEQLESRRRLLESQSLELVSKEKELECVRESIKLSSSELELREKKIQSLNEYITLCGQETDSKCKELGDIKKLIEEKTSELLVKEKRHNEILEIICRSSSEMEERAKEIEAAETEASDLNVRSERFRHEVEGKEKELELLKNQIESEEEKLNQRKREIEELTYRKKKDLALILSKTEESGQQLAALNEQLESQRILLETQSIELVSKEMELECVGESSRRFKFDLEVKEKRFQALNNLITISSEQLDVKSKELWEIQRELELKKQSRQMSTVLVKCEKQPAAAPTNEDVLMHHGISASLDRHEVSSVLGALPNPAKTVLELVQENITDELDLQDSLVEILVLLFEELTEIPQSDDPQLQLKATQVATLWKEKITIEAPKSSPEALAFLLFIVAYGLKTLINEEETALLASSIAQYEQAPRLFYSLSLNPQIREFIKELIKKSHYIPAVRLICLFKLNKEVSFSPSELLMKEIINLRQSVQEKKPTEASQAEEKDAGRLRAILELVADYKLEIDLPGDLIAKLVVGRRNSSPLVRCSVEHRTSSSKPQANSLNLASSVNLRVPKPEPYLNPSGSGRS